MDCESKVVFAASFVEQVATNLFLAFLTLLMHESAFQLHEPLSKQCKWVQPLTTQVEVPLNTHKRSTLSAKATKERKSTIG